ncbi:MAG: glycosyltransferase family 2 protein [Candidatus Omnitrophica bacterium]|nr:glycosyltransferase family 2 protein [Candidatus Omnitrophota bacterium]
MTRSAEPSVSVVIPVYNAAATLPELVERLAKVLPAVAGRFELVLVNDGSRDRSWDVISRLAQAHSWIHPVNLMRNYGQHNAVLCGIRTAQHAVIVTMDDDLQHPPEEIPRLLEQLTPRCDVVYGTPQQEQHGWWRNLASQATKLALQGALGSEHARSVSAFRAFRSQVRDAFANYQNPFVSIDVLLTWSTTRVAAVPVRHEPRPSGNSSYTVRKLATHALNMMTGFSTWPLQLASLVGFTFTVFGAGVLVYVVGRYLIEGGGIPGFPFLASVIAIFSGAQLFALGIIGEYLARMHVRMMERPTYVVRREQP